MEEKQIKTILQRSYNKTLALFLKNSAQLKVGALSINMVSVNEGGFESTCYSNKPAYEKISYGQYLFLKPFFLLLFSNESFILI